MITVHEAKCSNTDNKKMNRQKEKTAALATIIYIIVKVGI